MRSSQPATRAVAYLRVSTEQQAQEGVSLAAQLQQARMYAELYGVQLVAVVEDAGVSAKTLARPGLQRALAMLDAGEADALLVVKLDRLTRSVRDLGHLLDNYFAKPAGPALLVVQEQVDTRSAAGRLVLNVLMSVAQWEREAIGERTSAALQHKAAQGQYTGGRAPYGWQVGDDGSSLQPVPQEQEAARLARQLREGGESLRGVGRQLLEAGHAPRRGGKWHASSIKVVLQARLAVEVDGGCAR